MGGQGRNRGCRRRRLSSGRECSMTEKLSTTFDEVADLYDAARPAYPTGLVEAIRSVLQGTQERILEIGCGTGQATKPFARQGCRVTALEPGQRLAALAAKNLAAFPQVDIQTTTFEDWPVALGQYDLVMSATAFHWVSPEVRYTKSAQALAAGGWLALFWNIEGNDESGVGVQIQAAYDKHIPPSQAHPNATHHPGSHSKQQDARISRWQEEINGSHLFGDVRVTQFLWKEWYTTEQYLRLLETYSDHRTLSAGDKRGLFEGVAEVLAQQGGGRSKPYVTILYLAQVRRLPENHQGFTQAGSAAGF